MFNGNSVEDYGNYGLIAKQDEKKSKTFHSSIFLDRNENLQFEQSNKYQRIELTKFIEVKNKLIYFFV